MTFEQLTERCKHRYFDQIVVVVKDVAAQMAAMQRIEGVLPGDIRVCDDTTDPGLKTEDGVIAYSEKKATYFYQNTQICALQPVEGETIYKKYLDRFGEGLCCVRERVSNEMFDYMMDHFAQKNLKIAQEINSDKCRAAWVDLMDELGFLFEIITDDSETVEPLFIIPKRICQINISTPDTQATIEKLADYLEIGPYEVGRQCNAVARDYGFRVDGEVKPTEFAFKLAMNVSGNIEWEIIEPEVGPLVYSEFIARHGIGFHHVLQEIPCAKWEETIKKYESEGAEINCKGGLGPIDWIYMNTEDALHYYSEMRTDAIMDKLPDGYVLYFWPEQNA